MSYAAVGLVASTSSSSSSSASDDYYGTDVEGGRATTAFISQVVVPTVNAGVVATALTAAQQDAARQKATDESRYPWGKASDNTRALQASINQAFSAGGSVCRLEENGILDDITCGAARATGRYAPTNCRSYATGCPQVLAQQAASRPAPATTSTFQSQVFTPSTNPVLTEPGGSLTDKLVAFVKKNWWLLLVGSAAGAAGAVALRKKQGLHKNFRRTSASPPPRLGTGERFALLEQKLRRRGVRDPGALAAYIGRKKYGKQKFQRLAARGRRKGR